MTQMANTDSKISFAGHFLLCQKKYFIHCSTDVYTFRRYIGQNFRYISIIRVYIMVYIVIRFRNQNLSRNTFQLDLLLGVIDYEGKVISKSALSFI